MSDDYQIAVGEEIETIKYLMENFDYHFLYMKRNIIRLVVENLETDKLEIYHIAIDVESFIEDMDVCRHTDFSERVCECASTKEFYPPANNKDKWCTNYSSTYGSIDFPENYTEDDKIDNTQKHALKSEFNYLKNLQDDECYNFENNYFLGHYIKISFNNGGFYPSNGNKGNCDNLEDYKFTYFEDLFDYIVSLRLRFSQNFSKKQIEEILQKHTKKLNKIKHKHEKIFKEYDEQKKIVKKYQLINKSMIN